MKQVMQSIKNVVLFLFGVVVIAAGYSVNDAHAQAKADAAEKARAEEVAAAEKARIAEEAAKAKAKTSVEKAKPEKASASKYKKEKKDKVVDAGAKK